MKTWIKGTNAVILSLAVVGIFIVLTLFLHSLKGVQWDLSKNKNYTLSDQTVNTLKELDKEVHVIIVANQQGGFNRQVMDLMAEYRNRNKKFTYEELDPKKKPTVAQQYKIDQYGMIVFSSGGKTKNVLEPELFAQGNAEGAYNFLGEEKFTQALLSLTSDVKHVVYLLSGHGEMTTQIATELTKSLQGEAYEVKDLNLAQETKVPDDAETVFILAPKNDISDKEAELIKTYIVGKGKLVVGLNLAKGMETWKNWNAILAAVGVKNQLAIAVETKKSVTNDPLVLVPTYSAHEITKKLQEQNRLTILPGGLALAVAEENKEVKTTALLTTSTESYAKTDLTIFTSGQKLTQDIIKNTAKDLKGPITLAYAVQDKESKPKAVVFGNGIFVTNDLINEQGNRDLLLNSAGWLQGQTNQLTIRPRVETQMQRVMISPAQGKMIYYGTFIVIPLLILLIGGAIWWRRRKG